MSKKRNKEGRAKAARPTSRLLCPRPPLGSFTKEMGRPVVDESCASRRAAKQETPSGRGKQPKGFQPISSEPTPSHRPWASAPGATPKRTKDGCGCLPCPNRNCNGGLRSGSEGPSLQQAFRRRSLQEGSCYPPATCRHRRGCYSAATALDVPA